MAAGVGDLDWVFILYDGRAGAHREIIPVPGQCPKSSGGEGWGDWRSHCTRTMGRSYSVIPDYRIINRIQGVGVQNLPRRSHFGWTCFCFCFSSTLEDLRLNIAVLAAGID
jgi:hypothetical protein